MKVVKRIGRIGNMTESITRQLQGRRVDRQHGHAQNNVVGMWRIRRQRRRASPVMVMVICATTRIVSCQDEVYNHDIRERVCAECGIEQNVGRDDPRVPEDLTRKMEHEIYEMNDYFASIIDDDERNRLVRPVCQNHNELCTFWKIQGHCGKDNDDDERPADTENNKNKYNDFVVKNCPLSCRLCDGDDFRTRQFLQLLWQQLPKVYYAEEEVDSIDVTKRRDRVLRFLFLRLGIDPDLLDRPLRTDLDGNWVEELLYARLMAVVPTQLRRMYDSPMLDDDDDDVRFLERVLGTNSLELVPYRNRGYVVQAMLDFDHYITRPIELAVGFSVPSRKVISEIAFMARSLQKKKVLHMGAGTGYFSTALKQLATGIDVVAYDLNPPAEHQNAFFERDFSNNTVLRGSCVDVLSRNQDLALSSMILFSWPNDPDPIDNPHFLHDENTYKGDEGSNVPSETVWDVDCLQAYIDAGGDAVVYIGERSDNLSSISSNQIVLDSGISSTLAFQNLLKEEFDLLRTIGVPQWWLNEDDVTIWRKLSTVSETDKDESSSEL